MAEDNPSWCHSYIGRLLIRIFSTISGSLSLIGSSLIIFMVCRRQTVFRRASHRLLFGISLVDIFNSLALGYSNRASPDDQCGPGNETICAIQGFFVQLGFAVPSYNAMICVAYLLIVRYDYTEEDLKGLKEIMMHLYALVPMPIFAIYGAVNKLFFGSQTYCWFHGERSAGLIIAVNSFMSMNFLIIATSMIMMLCGVWKRERAMDQYAFPGAHESPNRSLTKRAMVQGSLYVCCFVFTYIWSVGVGIDAMLYMTSRKRFANVLVIDIIQSIFVPLQGVWNFIAFVLLRVRDIRLQNPEMTVFAATKQIVLQKTETIGVARRGSV